MTVTLLAFARLRELLGFGERAVQLPARATAADAWNAARTLAPAIAPLRETTRFARNGAVVPPECELRDGDELALLPPVGGG